MFRTSALALSVSLSLIIGSGATGYAPNHQAQPKPGAPGVGDPYYPRDGNGGYDVSQYELDLTYQPDTNRLSGVARIGAAATQDLSAFNLDLDGMRVTSITVDGDPATWERNRGELIITPSPALLDGAEFATVVRYAGVPKTINDLFGTSGFLHTDDGTVIVGEPHVAATWYPVNDHPTDQAAYTFHITVPRGLEAVANGVLVGKTTDGAMTTWRWRAAEPMASYLTTVDIGNFDLHSYRRGGLGFVDAVDPDLFDLFAKPRTGKQYAISRKTGDGPASYKRLARTISVPQRGARLAFSLSRETEPDWDYVFVEAQPVGSGDWTTLPDENGHTSRDTGLVCPFWLGLHPFLRHYQTSEGDTCAPRGTTGRWHAASGTSDGYERWQVDLSAYAGEDVRLSISYASDEAVQFAGVFVDDIVVSAGTGSTSFEDDGNTFDGWEVPGAPPGSPPNPNDWIVGTAAGHPATLGEVAERSFARQPEVVRFLSADFGPYPFSTAGGIVDDTDRLLFALETQTRPVYTKFFFRNPVSGDSVVVHELAHQWFGDSLAVARWRHIWLNEGFATYAEWLWSGREGLGTPQQIFDFFYRLFPAGDPFWALRIGNPGPDHLFEFAVYARGAMTLHQLRQKVGSVDFFAIVQRWATSRAGDNVRTGEFVRLAEKVSGEELNPLFRKWLFTTRRPSLPGARMPASDVADGRTSWSEAPAAAHALLQRVGRQR